MTDHQNPELSEREIEILEMVATGASNKEIAQKLFISTNTVKVHLRNIFTKLDVSSRTEATMWAIRQGLVQPFSEAELESLIEAGEDEPEPEAQASPRRIWFLGGAAVLVAGLILVLIWVLTSGGAAQPDPTSVGPTSQPAAVTRWSNRQPMPAARTGLAAVTYEGLIYAIGGEAGDGVTGIVERYDPERDEWQTLDDKPTPVSFAQGAVIGGRIFVPGGELNSGEVTDVLEIYDPRLDQWETGPALPVPLSGYALAAYEGRLYMFGGFDGEQYRRQVYTFTPGNPGEPGVWREMTSMPGARGFLGAAASGGKIYLIGGLGPDGQPLARSDIYTPALDDGQNDPWQDGMPLPEARAHQGMTNVGDLIFVMGGAGSENRPLSNLQFSPAANLWQRVENPVEGLWKDPGVAPLGTQIYVLGGSLDTQPSDRLLTYQAIFTISVPFLP
ncbi:MAG: LuxR C-terminal-related transcriptional regulator [Anaerolineales bacterium]|jgi:DNA-binding CsgD family transcriptional regulator